MSFRFFLKAVVTVSVFAALLVAVIHVFLSSAYAKPINHEPVYLVQAEPVYDWMDDLTMLLRMAKGPQKADVTLSYCGRVSKSDLSLIFRRVHQGARPNITPPIPAENRYYWFVRMAYRARFISRRVYFTCHHYNG